MNVTVRFNPNHAPVGGSGGGQFTESDGPSAGEAGVKPPSAGGESHNSGLVPSQEITVDRRVSPLRFYINPLPGRLSSIVRNDPSGAARILVLGQNIAATGGEAAIDEEILAKLEEAHPALEDVDGEHWKLSSPGEYKVCAVSVGVDAREDRWPAGLFRALGVRPVRGAMRRRVAMLNELCRSSPSQAQEWSDGIASVLGGDAPLAAMAALLERYNPNHAPGGSGEGGQFTSGDGGPSQYPTAKSFMLSGSLSGTIPPLMIASSRFDPSVDK